MMAKHTIERLKEPIAELVELRDALNEAAEKDWIGNDAVFAKFFYEECTPGITKLLARERSNDPKYLEVAADMLKAFIRTKNHHLPDGPKPLCHED